MLSEILELNRIRLDEDLTFEALGRAVGVHPKTLYRALTKPNARLHDRNVHKIRRYLDRRKRPRAAIGAAS